MPTITAAGLTSYMQRTMAAYPQLRTWKGIAEFCSANRDVARPLAKDAGPLAAIALAHAVVFSNRSLSPECHHYDQLTIV